MNRFSVILVWALFLATSVGYTQNAVFTEKKVGHVFSVSVPDYLQETRGLNDAASFQYQNEVKQAYTMVIDDAKSGLQSLGISFASPEEYYHSIESFYLAEGDDVTQALQNMSVNGQKAVQISFVRHFDQVDLAYLITIVETPNYFYQIVSWTSVENSNALMPDFKKIAQSLKE